MALSRWFEERTKTVGLKQAQTERSRLLAVRSKRTYNLPSKERLMPGASFATEGRRYVLRAREGNGSIYITTTGEKFKAGACRLLTHNTGLVYL